MTKQEAKRYIHETYSNTELYPEAVKQFRECEGEWDCVIQGIKAGLDGNKKLNTAVKKIAERQAK